VGDFNEAVGEDASGIVSIIQDLNVTDMVSSRQNQELPTKNSRGRRCLDYRFATAQAALKACGYESFSHRFPSDHGREYFLAFDIRRLFGTSIQPFSQFEPRLLHSMNANQVTAYLKRMEKILLSCNA
jgi:hypothetical protein